jgi:hypothetical protein
MITMPGKPSGITNALTGNPMFFSYNMRIYSREHTACPCKHFKSLPNYWETTLLLMNLAAQCSAHVPPEIVVAVGLQYISSGKCLDLKTAYGLSLLSVYRCRDLFMMGCESVSRTGYKDACNSVPIVWRKLPRTLLQ